MEVSVIIKVEVPYIDFNKCIRSKCIFENQTSESYPTNILPLISDCRNLLARAWEVHVLHVYREVNACADVLAKRGARQRHVLSVYSPCPSFVYVCFVRDMAGLGSNRICTQRPIVGDV